MKPSKTITAYLRKIAARGGKKRAKVLSRERRVAIAKAAIAARWAKEKRRKQ